MQRVLLLSDAAAIVAASEAALRPDGRVLRTEATPEHCLLAAREWRPSLVLLDLSIGLTGGALTAFLRDESMGEGLGLIAIAAPEHLETVTRTPRFDDFVLEPIDEDELRARVARVLWELTGADDEHMLARGALVIDLERYKVTVDGDIVDLTYKEYELLRFLASNPGKPFTREALLNQVWGYDYYGGSRTVDVHIRRIRSKIERREQFIDTVRNVGYRFIEVTR